MGEASHGAAPGPVAADGPRLFLRVYWTAVGVLGVATMVGIVALTLLQVISRYVVGGALFWPEEAARFLLIVLTFVLAGASFARGEMVAVTILVERLGRPLALAAAVVADLLVLALLSLVVWYGWSFAAFNASQISAALQVSMYWVYLAVPVGGAILFVHVAAALVARVFALRA